MRVAAGAEHADAVDEPALDEADRIPSEAPALDEAEPPRADDEHEADP